MLRNRIKWKEMYELAREEIIKVCLVSPGKSKEQKILCYDKSCETCTDQHFLKRVDNQEGSR